jgi:hypothetical protein
MRKYVNEAMQVMYEDAEGIFEDGIISAEQFHEYDDCLVPELANVNPPLIENKYRRKGETT